MRSNSKPKPLTYYGMAQPRSETVVGLKHAKGLLNSADRRSGSKAA